jgi:hypothetical protein
MARQKPRHYVIASDGERLCSDGVVAGLEPRRC